jgi:hypothetical protein
MVAAPERPILPTGATRRHSLPEKLALIVHFGEKNSPGNGVPCSHNASTLKRVT